MWRTSSKETGTNATKKRYTYHHMGEQEISTQAAENIYSDVTEAPFRQRELFVVFEKCLRDIDVQYSEDNVTSQEDTCHFRAPPSIPSSSEHTRPLYPLRQSTPSSSEHLLQRKCREKFANARYEGLQSRLIPLLPMFLYALVRSSDDTHQEWKGWKMRCVCRMRT
jgi:hypothetical protein